MANGRTLLRTPKFLLVAAAVATALTLSACSGGTPSTGAGGPTGAVDAPGSAPFNPADVTFAQMMIPHHEQAVEMSKIILAKDGIDEQVLDLATQIKAAQEPEIAQLKEWLTAWGADEADSSGMDHGSDGMMSDDDMSALQDASGVKASKLFLEQMVIHHEGAIVTAQEDLDEGLSADAQAMATAIVTTQTDEIAVMKGILATL